MQIDESKMKLANQFLRMLKAAMAKMPTKYKHNKEKSKYDIDYPAQVRAFLHAYRNGRENGYSVTVHGNWKELGLYGSSAATVIFAENRNSDHLVIYFLDSLQDDLTDEAYEGRHLCYIHHPAEAKNAVKLCIKHLTANL